MNFDRIVSELGEFGPYQRRCFFLLCLPNIPHAMQTLGILFTMGSQDHRCAIPQLSNDTYNYQGVWHRDVIDQWIPTDSQRDRSCRMYRSEPSTEQPTNQTVQCSKYVYDTSVFDTTITSDMQLVCEDKSLTTYANMIFMAGMLVGSLIMGSMSDLVGRKKILIASIIGHFAVSLTISFFSSYTLFVVLRFMTGFFGVSIFVTSFVMGVELVGPKTRRIAGYVVHIFWNIGLFINVLLAFLIREWRYLQIVMAASSVFLIPLTFLIPESPRWLIRKGRYEEASEIIHKAARVNGVSLSGTATDLICHETEGTSAKIWHLFMTKTLFKRTMVLLYIWTISSMVYFGLSLNTGSLSGNIFINVTLSSLVELVAYVICLLLLDKVGRKPFMCGSILVSGLACLGTMAPVMCCGDGLSWITVTLAMVGKLGVCMIFSVVFIYSAEVFPTEIRNSAMGLCSFMARVGAILSPYIADLGKIVSGDLGIALPLIVFGIVGIVAGGFVLLLPETTNKGLPENIHDAENVGRNNNLKQKQNELCTRGNYSIVTNGFGGVTKDSTEVL